MTWSKDFLLLVYLKSVWFKDHYNKVFDYNRWNGFIKKHRNTMENNQKRQQSIKKVPEIRWTLHFFLR